MRPGHTISRIRRWPLADLWLAAQVLVLLGVSRLRVRWLTEGRLEAGLGDRGHTIVDESTTAAEVVELQRVGRVVSTVSRRTPWESACLTQAMAARSLVARLGLHSTICVGATISDSLQSLEAHAWLVCGDTVVVGDHELDRYGAMVTYS